MNLRRVGLVRSGLRGSSHLTDFLANARQHGIDFEHSLEVDGVTIPMAKVDLGHGPLGQKRQVAFINHSQAEPRMAIRTETKAKGESDWSTYGTVYTGVRSLDQLKQML